MDRWSLPGPASFLADVEESVREGENVVIGAPSLTSDALAEAIEHRVAEPWSITGPLEASSQPPLDQLWEALEIEPLAGSPSRRSVSTLLSKIDQKQVILVTKVGARTWPQWRSFLDEYANASRDLSTFDRSQIVLVTSGVPKSALPGRAPALRKYVWDGIVGESDALSYVISAWREADRPIDATAKLRARIITRLALWDFDLIDRMLDMPDDELFDPVTAISNVCDLIDHDSKLDANWEDGTEAEFDGIRLEHSGRLAHRGDPRGELRMRLWAAQASEILPALEICRRELTEHMERFRQRLIPSHKEPEIGDLIDLEIGNLARIADNFGFPREIIRASEKFAKLRNRLAHLRPLDVNEALDPDVLAGRAR